VAFGEVVTFERLFSHNMGNAVYVSILLYMTVSFTKQRTPFCSECMRALASENLMTSACSIRMQAEQQYALHNGQDAADPSAAQSTPAVASSFPIQLMTVRGGHITVQAHSGMTVRRVKEMYEVCSCACEHALCLRM
jgi:hypothetical protein